MKLKTIYDLDELSENQRQMIAEQKKQFLRKTHDELDALRISHTILSNAITGSFKGEPFCVYMKHAVSREGALVGVVITRYKGKDWPGEKPGHILKKEGGA